MSDDGTLGGGADGDPAGTAAPTGLPGQLACERLHDEMMDLEAVIQQQAGSQENETIKALIEEAAETIKSLREKIADTHSGEYPDAEPLTPKDDDDGTATDDGAGDTTVTKSLKPSDRRKKSLALVRKHRESRWTKRLGKSVTNCVLKAADFLHEGAEHVGDWRESQRTAAGAHRDALRVMCKSADMQSGTAGDLEREGLKSLQAENETLKTTISERDADLAKYREKVPAMLKSLETLERKYKAAIRGA